MGIQGPPFERHEASLGTLESSREDLVTAAKGYRDVAVDVRRGVAVAARETEGGLPAAVRSSAGPVVKQAGELAEASAWGSDTLGYWSVAVRRFNRRVDELNQIWDDAVADNFGKGPRKDMDTDASSAAQVERERQEATAAAREALAMELRRKHAHALRWVDERGDTAASMLGRGPNAADVRRLADAGVLEGVDDAIKETAAAYGLSASSTSELGKRVSDWVAKNYMMTIPGYLGPERRVPGPFTLNKGDEVTMRNLHKRDLVPPKVVPHDEVRRSAGHWRRAFKGLGIVGDFGIPGWDEWRRANKAPLGRRLGRTIMNAATVGGGALLGGALGAKIGAAAGAAGGSAVPVVGNVVGGVVGGVVGAVTGGAAGAEAADRLNDGLVDWGGDVGDKVDDIGDEAGDVLDKVNPW